MTVKLPWALDATHSTPRKTAPAHISGNVEDASFEYGSKESMALQQVLTAEQATLPLRTKIPAHPMAFEMAVVVKDMV